MESQVLQRFVMEFTEILYFVIYHYTLLYGVMWYPWFVGLGTSTSKEAKEYFADMKRHRIQFKYSGPEDDAAISLVSLSCILYIYSNFRNHYIGQLIHLDLYMSVL